MRAINARKAITHEESQSFSRGRGNCKGRHDSCDAQHYLLNGNMVKLATCLKKVAQIDMPLFLQQHLTAFVKLIVKSGRV